MGYFKLISLVDLIKDQSLNLIIEEMGGKNIFFFTNREEMNINDKWNIDNLLFIGEINIDIWLRELKWISIVKKKKIMNDKEKCVNRKELI
jgi:hypothetical protein